MCTISNAFPRTTSCVTPAHCLFKAAAEFEEARDVLYEAFRAADEDTQIAVFDMHPGLGLPDLESLDPACIPSAIARAVSTLVDEANALDY